MALTRLDYLEHLRGILRFALLAPSGEKTFFVLLPAAVAYAKAGSTGPIRAARREAVQTLMTLAWSLLGRTHDAHSLKHAMLQAGIESPDAEDIPETAEPTP